MQRKSSPASFAAVRLKITVGPTGHRPLVVEASSFYDQFLTKLTAGQVYSEKRNVTVWCLSVSLSVGLSLPYF